jgi:hypothetical protein
VIDELGEFAGDVVGTLPTSAPHAEPRHFLGGLGTRRIETKINIIGKSCKSNAFFVDFLWG